MKKLFIIITLALATDSYGQDSTIITNVQFKAITIRTLETAARNIQYSGAFESYLKWYNNFKQNNPADNANVTIDTIPVPMLAELYSIVLFDVRYQDVLDDFTQSLVSKRATNDYLDRLMTTHEDGLQAMKDQLIATSRFKLIE